MPYLTGTFRRQPGLCNVRMCMGALWALSKMGQCDVLFPPIPSSPNPSDPFLPPSALFDLDNLSVKGSSLGDLSRMSRSPSTLYKTPKIMARPSKHDICRENLRDMWMALRRCRELSCGFLVHEFLRNLKPSRGIQTLADRVLSKISKPFVAVHFRIEDDWKTHQGRKNTKIFYGPKHIVSHTNTFLKSLKFVPKSILAISSSRIKEDGFTHRCMLYPQANDLCYAMRSAIDFEVALHADGFVGNGFSSFSSEICRHLREKGIPCSFYDHK